MGQPWAFKEKFNSRNVCILQLVSYCLLHYLSDKMVRYSTEEENSS